jgi:hypothetical protein
VNSWISDVYLVLNLETINHLKCTAKELLQKETHMLHQSKDGAGQLHNLINFVIRTVRSDYIPFQSVTVSEYSWLKFL